MIYLVTAVVAFCSMCYELLLGQALSAYLGHTVLRYSVTIGLYLFSLGAGALLFEASSQRRPLFSLFVIEVALSLLGCASLFLLQGVDMVAGAWGVSLVGHGLVIVIGALSGVELPLLLRLKAEEGGPADATVIGVNYFGAFAGTVCFATVLYPKVGLILSMLAVALLNSVAGLLLLLKREPQPPADQPVRWMPWMAVQGLVCVTVAVALLNGSWLQETFIQTYLRAK